MVELMCRWAGGVGGVLLGPPGEVGWGDRDVGLGLGLGLVGLVVYLE